MINGRSVDGNVSICGTLSVHCSVHRASHPRPPQAKKSTLLYPFWPERCLKDACPKGVGCAIMQVLVSRVNYLLLRSRAMLDHARGWPVPKQLRDHYYSSSSSSSSWLQSHIAHILEHSPQLVPKLSSNINTQLLLALLVLLPCLGRLMIHCPNPPSISSFHLRLQASALPLSLHCRETLLAD